MLFTGAKKAHEVIFSVLRDSCLDGDLSVHEAVEAAKAILSENSTKFYNIKLPVKSFWSTNSISPIPATIRTTALSGITLVRILWVDASGQQRCRVSFLFFSFVLHFFFFFLIFLFYRVLDTILVCHFPIHVKKVYLRILFLPNNTCFY